MKPSSAPFNLCEYFLGDERLQAIGDRTAIEFLDSRITYSELRGLVDHWAERMLSSGLGAGDRCVILLPDSPHFIACFLASALIGAICVPTNTFLPPEGVSFIASDAGAKLIITETEWISRYEFPAGSSVLGVDSSDYSGGLKPGRQFAVDTTMDSPAFLLYTSGSTGTPKGVLHQHGSIPATVSTYGETILRLESHDRVYSSSRMFFAYGLGNSLSFPLAAGATVVLDPERPTPEKITSLIADRAPTVFFGVPAVYLALLEKGFAHGKTNCENIRLWVSAGEALPRRIFEDWNQEIGRPILDGIGSTEMLHIFISNSVETARAGSSGRLVDGYSARLLDDNADQVAEGEPGNLFVSGPSATVGYWNRPDLTAQTINDGWVRTGDIYTQEAGFYSHVGRSDDCFKVKGLWVSPVEVESVLSQHDLVSEAAVVSSTDENGLATARAFVVIRQGERSDALKEKLRSFTGSRLPHYKVPSQIEFIDEMPRTATGKVQRYKLREVGRRA
jgi:benzoate-CoA ligase family protein